MEIELIKPYGFCFGVKRALEIAKLAKSENPNENVYILGGLVHNENVQNDLVKNGLTLLDDKEKSIDEWICELPEGSIIVFSAHGHSPRIDEIAKKKNMKIYDATCPFVKDNEKAIIKEVSNDNDVIYIGKENHAESLAAIGIDENKVRLMEHGKDFDFSKISSNCPFVISQTTMALEEIDSCITGVLKHFPNAKVSQGRCYATKERQNSVYNAPKNTDCFIILGSVTSNNTNKLEEIAKKTHANVSIIRALSFDDIVKSSSKIKGYKHIRIVSGASTPDDLIEKIYDYIKNLKV